MCHIHYFTDVPDAVFVFQIDQQMPDGVIEALRAFLIGENFSLTTTCSISVLHTARNGSKRSFLLILSFNFPPFGSNRIWFSHNYYGLRITVLKLALRRWQGKTPANAYCRLLNVEIWIDIQNKHSHCMGWLNLVICRVLLSLLLTLATQVSFLQISFSATRSCHW